MRSILLSEVGYSSSSGQGTQAAAVVYAYLQCACNQYIDGLILSREMDHYTEVAQGLAFGLLDSSGNRKTAYAFYQGIDGADAQSYIDQAEAVIGVEDINSILTPR